MDDPFIILSESSRFELYPSFFEISSLAVLRVVFGCAFKEPSRNSDTISRLKVFVFEERLSAKTAWDNASLAFQHGYRAVDFIWNAYEKKEADRQNKKLFAEVKRCKKKYERWGKVINIIKEYMK